jgi:hypothetical protein
MAYGLNLNKFGLLAAEDLRFLSRDGWDCFASTSRFLKHLFSFRSTATRSLNPAVASPLVQLLF